MGTLTEELVQLQQDLAEKKTSKAAWEIINDYFSFFSIETINHELWILTIGAVTNDELQQSEKGKERYNHIFFYEYTKMLLEAIAVLHNNQQGKP